MASRVIIVALYYYRVDIDLTCLNYKLATFIELTLTCIIRLIYRYLENYFGFSESVEALDLFISCVIFGQLVQCIWCKLVLVEFLKSG